MSSVFHRLMDTPRGIGHFAWESTVCGFVARPWRYEDLAELGCDHGLHQHAMPLRGQSIPVAAGVHTSEDVTKADPFLGRSRVRFRVPPWVSNKIARDHLA